MVVVMDCIFPSLSSGPLECGEPFLRCGHSQNQIPLFFVDGYVMCLQLQNMFAPLQPRSGMKPSFFCVYVIWVMLKTTAQLFDHWSFCTRSRCSICPWKLPSGCRVVDLEGKKQASF